MLYDILAAITTVLQFFAMLFVLGVFFAVGPFAMLYLMSQGFRDFWLDYESWLDRKLYQRRMKRCREQHHHEYDSFSALVGYAKADLEFTMLAYENLNTNTETEIEDADPRK
jgi:hypothetical protein